MKLLIEIPKEFEQHFQADRFDDSLHRLSADAHLLAGLYEQEIALMLSESFKNAVPIPPHGRLIDADALGTKLNKMLTMAFGEGNTAFHFAYRSLGKVVENAPTIIPAEEGE